MATVFLAEIRTKANLRHPRILPRFDRQTLLPIVDAVQLTREVADAPQHAHERGVIHRDIKPENILLQGGGHPMTQTGPTSARRTRSSPR